MVDVVILYCHGQPPTRQVSILPVYQDTAVLALGAMSHNRLVRHDDSNYELLTLARNVRSVAGLFRSEAKWISSKGI